jgi:hypothetical protein
MRLDKKLRLAFGAVLALCLVAVTLYVLPITTQFIENERAYQTRVAYRDNYKLHTTPLSPDILFDICSKLEITETSESCQANKIVYAPELFDETECVNDLRHEF